MSAALCWRCVVTDFFLSTTLKGIPSDPQSHQSRPPGSETLIASEARRQRLPAVNNEPSRPTSLGLAPRDLMLRGFSLSGLAICRLASGSLATRSLTPRSLASHGLPSGHKTSRGLTSRHAAQRHAALRQTTCGPGADTALRPPHAPDIGSLPRK